MYSMLSGALQYYFKLEQFFTSSVLLPDLCDCDRDSDCDSDGDCDGDCDSDCDSD